MTTTTPLALRVLGPLEVDLDGSPRSPWVGPSSAVYSRCWSRFVGRVVGVDRIIEALWPEGDPPDGANRSVLTYVSRFGRCFRPGRWRRPTRVPARIGSDDVRH